MCNHEGAATVMVGGMEVELCEECEPRHSQKTTGEPYDDSSRTDDDSE